MNAVEVAPDTLPYDIEKQETVVEARDLRVVRLTLAPGQEVPWHWHTAVTDRIVCLEGALRIETRAPRRSCELAPGEVLEIAPKVAHTVRNAGAGRARFLNIQGIGAYDYNPVG